MDLKQKSYRKLSLLILAAISLSGCHPNDGSQGTSTGNPVVALRFDSYVTTASAKSDRASADASETAEAMAISEIKMCFNRLRFKTSGSSGSSNTDLNLGEVTLSPSGTDLTELELAAGTYTRIEFDLDDECGSGHSLRVINGNGTFESDEHIQIRFEGTFVHDGTPATLNLAVQQITSALNTVSGSGQLRTRAESASGSF